MVDHGGPWWTMVDHGGIKKQYFFNQTKHMIDQKNGIDPATTEHHHLENEVDFEILLRCISKIWRTTKRWCMRGGILKLE